MEDLTMLRYYTNASYFETKNSLEILTAPLIVLSFRSLLAKQEG